MVYGGSMQEALDSRQVARLREQAIRNGCQVRRETGADGPVIIITPNPDPVTVVRTVLLAGLRAVEVGVVRRLSMSQAIRAARRKYSLPGKKDRAEAEARRRLRPLESVLLCCRAGHLVLRTAGGEGCWCTVRLPVVRCGEFEALVPFRLLKDLARLHPARRLELLAAGEDLQVTGADGPFACRSRLKGVPVEEFLPLPAGPERWQNVPVEAAVARLSEEKLRRHLRSQARQAGADEVEVAETEEARFFRLPAFELVVGV